MGVHLKQLTKIGKFFFFLFNHCEQNVGSYFLDQGSNLCFLQWKHGVLTTGQPGKLVTFCVTILILEMLGEKQLFWPIMLYNFKKGKNTAEIPKKKKDLFAVYEEGAGTD